MQDEQPARPFGRLGKRLKALRDQSRESLAEASEAVEIGAKELASFELGQVRPSEDILLLLLSHFGARDDEALKLWEMAGYSVDQIPMAQMSSQKTEGKESPQLSEKPILFTDVVDIMVNNYGVVMKFMQSTGPKTQPNVVSKVGMSREHAKSLLKILKTTIEKTEAANQGHQIPRRLPAPDAKPSDDLNQS